MTKQKSDRTPRTLLLTEIGYLTSDQTEPYQAGRQPDNFGNTCEIQLFSGQNYEQALTDLQSCTHIWVIFGFHQNQNWKPMVSTPRSDKKIGVFATRAPYRPNPIGISLVKLISINDLTVTIEACDILDQSPIFDIKPYHPEADIAHEAQIGWLNESSANEEFEINLSPFAEDQITWLKSKKLNDLEAFIYRQLKFDPINKKKKRLEENTGYWTLCYRTWRIDFSVNQNTNEDFDSDNETQQNKKTIGILSIRSGYSDEDLMNEEDPYQDKSLHRLFKQNF